MLRALGGIGRILAQTWPALLAWYLGGSLVRASVIALAAPIGPESPLAALLLVPIAVLARLVSYIGMFLVLRRALPGYREASAGDLQFHSFKDAVADFARVLQASIGPFFTLYAVIGLLNEDLLDYGRAAFRYSFGSENGVINVVGDGPLALTVVVVAFVGRMLLTVFAKKLPDWVAVPQIYLEATWVFVALTAVGAFFGSIQEWIENRQVVHWWENAREFLTGLWEPIRLAIEGIDWLTPVALQLVLLPLAWILIASIIYLRSLANVVEDAIPVPERVSAEVRARVSRVPKVLRDYAHIVTGTWQEVGRPLVFSSRVILSAGVRNVIVFLCAYGLLFAAGKWLERASYALVGAHEYRYWVELADPVLFLIVSAVIEPIRVVLLAAAFDFCLKRWRDRRMVRLEPQPELPLPGIPAAS